MHRPRIAWPLFGLLMLAMLALGVGTAHSADPPELPDVVDPTGCRVGAVLSLDQFTTTGMSNVRTGQPNHDVVAGAWAIVDNRVANTGVTATPNCATSGPADAHGLNLMGVRLTPTAVSAGAADIERVKLVRDVNLNGLYDPGLDQVIQAKPGRALDRGNGALFYFAPQSPLLTLANSSGRCTLTTVQNGTNCAAGLLAVAKLGDGPRTNAQFGLELAAAAGDIPGTPGNAAVATSSGFASSENPKASNVRVDVVGGQPSSPTELRHRSNSSGPPESGIERLALNGLKTRFRAEAITPGTREAIAIAVAICDGGALTSTTAEILPQVAAATPTIAGGLGSIPCVPSDSIDRLATGINGATLVMSGPPAEAVGTVRMYVDEQAADRAGGGQTHVTPGNGALFEAGELVTQQVAKLNADTGEAIARFGPESGQVLASGHDTPVATPGSGTSQPMVLVFTVDIDASATPGALEVKLALETFDDTAQGANGPCNEHIQNLAALNKSSPFNCGSNFASEAPEARTVTVESKVEVASIREPADLDRNGNGRVDDGELMDALARWNAGELADPVFYRVLEAWTSNTRLDGLDPAAGLALERVGLARQPDGGRTFVAHGQNVEAMHLAVYTLGGRRVAAQQAQGPVLRWQPMRDDGKPLANGVYLYRVTAHGPHGKTEQTGLRKLVMVR